MNIGLNGMILTSPFTTGVEKVVINLTESLYLHLANLQSHHKIILFTPKTEKKFIQNNNKPYLLHKYFRLPLGTRMERIFIEHCLLPFNISTMQCDVVIFPAYISSFFNSFPNVLIIHDCFALTHPEWCKLSNSIYCRIFFAHSVKNASVVVVPSNYVKNELINIFPEIRNKIEVVYFAVPTHINRVRDKYVLKTIRERYKLPNKYLLFVGNAEPKKNLKFILKTFKKLKTDDTGFPYSLVITGGKQWKENIGNLILEQNLEKDVIVTGYVPDEDISAIYSLAHVLLYPSLSEGFGFPILEAMQCGIPVITSNKGALPEIAGEGALLIDPCDIQGFAKAINEVLSSNSLRNELAKKSHYNLQRFSWKHTAERIFKLCENAINSRTRPGF